MNPISLVLLPAPLKAFHFLDVGNIAEDESHNRRLTPKYSYFAKSMTKLFVNLHLLVVEGGSSF